MIKDLDTTKIKFLPVSQENLILSLDRLTRFKYPEFKYNRVFTDILCKYLLCPKLSKKQISQLDTKIFVSLIETIWNESVKQYLPEAAADLNFNNAVNNDIYNTYEMTDSLKSLIEAKLNINGVISIINRQCNYDNLPVNLKYLLKLQEKPSIDTKDLRQKYNLLFPVEKVILCEGVTEEILLPEFAKLYGYDFYKCGVKLLGAGGKNQVPKLYCELKNELKIPVFILLDADAQATAQTILPVLRDIDDIYLIRHGEFEDIFSLNLIKRTVNNSYKNICESSLADFKQNAPMTKILAEFFRIHELGDFQKAEFAKELALNLKYKTDLTDEIKEIIDKIKEL